MQGCIYKLIVDFGILKPVWDFNSDESSTAQGLGVCVMKDYEVNNLQLKKAIKYKKE